MNTSKVVQKLALRMVVACLALGAFRGAEATLQCNEVERDLIPCVSYLLNGGEKVDPDCCKGIKTLYGKAQTSDDRRAVCTCIKNAVKGIKYNSKNLAYAAGLPAKCKVNIPYTISPNTDCKSVN